MKFVNLNSLYLKKISKLQINSEKIIKNEELVSLRGGYGGGTIVCYEWGSMGGYCGGSIKGYINGPCSEALYMCITIFGGGCVYC